MQTDDLVVAQSLEEEGTPTRTLQGTLEILDIPTWEYYPAFTAFFVDGQEADETTITLTTKPALAASVELQNDCHNPEDGRFCGDASHGHKNPVDIHEAVYMAGERFGGDLSGGTRHYQDVQDAANQIAAGKNVGNRLNTRSGKELADKDAAILMAALPATGKNGGTLYRGTAPDEGSPYDPTARGRRELSPGDEISLPLTAVTLDETVAKDRVYNRGAIYEFPAGSTPFIPIQGIVGGLQEGITGGKFRVKAVDYESNLDGVSETQRVVLEHIADHGSEARKQMKDNGWTFGEDLSIQAAAEPEPNMNTNTNTNTVTAARAEPTPMKGPYDRYTSVFEAAEKLSGNHPYGSQGTLSYYSDVQRQAVRIALGLPTQFIEDRLFLKEAAILMSAIPQSPPSPGVLYRGAQEFEVSRKRDGIEVFDHFDMPIAPATPHRKTAESFAKGLLIKISHPIPWIKTEGTAKLEEGFISGRFIVTAITYQDSLKTITVTQTDDYLLEAYAVLAENGWDYGEDVSFNLTASAALVLPKLYDYTKIYQENDIFASMKTFYGYLTAFQNDCHSPEDGRFCEGDDNEAAHDVYRGQHQPPSDGPTIDNLTGPDSWFPDDVYDHPEFYDHTGGQSQADRESAAVLRRVRGKPDAMVTIYRAAPPGITHINKGDWVAVSKAYAEQHAMQGDDPENDWPTYSIEVPARTIRNGGNDIVEWGYWGDDKPAITASVLDEFGNRKGNFEALRRWYTEGGGADRIAWGTEGDFTRCMKLVSKYLPPGPTRRILPEPSYGNLR